MTHYILWRKHMHTHRVYSFMHYYSLRVALDQQHWNNSTDDEHLYFVTAVEPLVDEENKYEQA